MPEEKKIRFTTPPVHYPFYAHAEPLITLPNNSRCDPDSLKAERKQFEEAFKAAFGVSPDEYHLKDLEE